MKGRSGWEPREFRVDIDERVVDATPEIDQRTIASAVDERLAEAARSVTGPTAAPKLPANGSRHEATIGTLAIGQAVAAAIMERGPR
jgi:hypothetical protein